MKPQIKNRTKTLYPSLLWPEHNFAVIFSEDCKTQLLYINGNFKGKTRLPEFIINLRFL
jgi:hypothetical protein